MTQLAAPALPGVKWSYVSRLVPDGLATGVASLPGGCRAGDYLVARVRRVREPAWLEDRHGRLMELYPRDLIVGAFDAGCRGHIGRFPAAEADASAMLMSAGGLISVAPRSTTAVTELEIMGALVDQTLRPFSCEQLLQPLPAPERPALGTVAVVTDRPGGGNVALGVIRGWVRAGFDVGAGRVTGCATGAAHWSYLDAGATLVAETLDFGMPSSFGYSFSRVVRTALAIRDRLAQGGTPVVVLEVCGLPWAAAEPLLEQLRFDLDAVVLEASDPVEAFEAADTLRRMGVAVRAIAGPAAAGLIGRRAAAAAGVLALPDEEVVEVTALSLLGRSSPSSSSSSSSS